MLPIDPSFARGEWSLRQLVWTETFAVALAASIAAPPIAAGLGLDPIPVLVHLLLHAIVYATCVLVVGHERLCRPSWWPVRLVDHVARLSVASAFGAAAHAPLSPMWSLVLLFGLIWGHAVPHDPVVVALIVVVPLSIRVLWAPAGSVDVDASMGVIGVSLLAVALYGSSSRAARRIRSDRRRAEAERAILHAAREETASLRAAMSLHDGLSGALYVARRRARTSSPEEAASIARGCIARMREVMEDIQRGGLGRDARSTVALERALTSAREIGRVHKVGAMPPVEQHADLAFIVTELAANARRHGGGELLVELRHERRGTVLRARSSFVPGARVGNGRGLRNVRLRAEGHGGTMGIAQTGGQFEVEVVLPREASRAFDVASVLLGALVYVAACAGLAWMSSAWGGLFVGLVGLVYLASIPVLLLSARRGLRDAASDRDAVEASPVVARLRSELLEHAEALELAATRGDTTAIREQLDGLARAVGDALENLEARPA